VRYRFIEREKAQYPIARLCRVRPVSRSGYDAWRQRHPSARAQADTQLTRQITAIPAESRATYGAPRIHAELRDRGVRCGRKRVARLMRTAGIVGCHRRRTTITTVRDAAVVETEDHLQRQFVATAPNQRWTADITYVPSWTGFLYLAVVLDIFSRRICVQRPLELPATNIKLAGREIAVQPMGCIPAWRPPVLGTSPSSSDRG